MGIEFSLSQLMFITDDDKDFEVKPEFIQSIETIETLNQRISELIESSLLKYAEN